MRVQDNNGHDTKCVPKLSATERQRILKCITSFDSETVNKMLLDAACQYPDILGKIENEASVRAAAERNKVLDFDYLSKSAWKTLNVTYDRLRDSQAFEMSGEAAASIQSDLKIIKRQCPETASFETKRSALETLRKIWKSICLSVGVIPREIRKDYFIKRHLSTTMLRIAESLSDAEKETLRPWCNGKLVELPDLGDDCEMSEALQKVVNLFTYEDDEDDDEGRGGRMRQ